MLGLPPNLKPYKKTPEFSQDSVPAGLLKSHATKAGTWAKIVILDGELLYRILEPVVEEIILTPQKHGVVAPQTEHEVVPRGDVRFYVEFYK